MEEEKVSLVESTSPKEIIDILGTDIKIEGIYDIKSSDTAK
jgi:hypothetical protein